MEEGKREGEIGRRGDQKTSRPEDQKNSMPGKELGFHIFPRRNSKLFFKNLGEMRGIVKTNFKCHCSDIPELLTQQCGSPLEPDGVDKFQGRLACKGI